jgi:hypothetical protein
VAAGLFEFWLAVTAVVMALWFIDLRAAHARGEAAKRSVQDLLAGRVAYSVYGGILLVGIVIPVLLLAGAARDMSAAMLAGIGVASVVGDFFIKYSTVKAGIHKRVRLPLAASARSS